MKTENNWLPTELAESLWGTESLAFSTKPYRSLHNFQFFPSIAFPICSMFHLMPLIILNWYYFPISLTVMSPPITANIQKYFDHFKMEKYSSSTHLCFPP